MKKKTRALRATMHTHPRPPPRPLIRPAAGRSRHRLRLPQHVPSRASSSGAAPVGRDPFPDPNGLAATTTLDPPSTVVIAALSAARRGDTVWLANIAASPLPPSPPPLRVGPRAITERGPLAAFAPLSWDTTARRVLPANLLRRCRLVGSLATMPGAAHCIRAGVVAATGEEALLDWSLVRGGGGVEGGGGAQPQWRVAAVRAVTGSVGDEPTDPLAAPGPHPRTSPEGIALLTARLLACGALAAASAFAAGPRGGPARGVALAPAAVALAGADGARLVVRASAGPTLRTCVVEVVEEGGVEGHQKRALFELCLKDSGCWAVRGTEGGWVVEI